MPKRSIGVTVLAFGTVMLAIYSQYAAISLLLTGSAFIVGGGLASVLTLIDGAAFLALAAIGYTVAFGLWTRRAWARTNAIALYATFLVANIMLSLLASNFVSAIVPTIAVVAGILYLRRADVRVELAAAEPGAALDGVRAPEVAPAAEPVR
jgi:hypothetical protein